MHPVDIHYRPALPADIARCIEIRGKTRQNPVSEEVLEEFGVTRASWEASTEKKQLIGFVAESQAQVVGFCFGDTESGEIAVLALLPEHEGYGMGKTLLLLVLDTLFKLGHQKVWLAASPEPEIRAYGFYRYLGWQPTGQIDPRGDEILEYKKPLAYK